jgi:two-component system LytT family response regulator
MKRHFIAIYGLSMLIHMCYNYSNLWWKGGFFMRIFICDDDLLFAGQLQKCIAAFFSKDKLKIPEIVIHNSGENLLEDHRPKDIVFLDIEMPGLNGIYVGNELKKANENIIIFVVTSYSEYLDDAMRFRVFRYLSKPLEKQRLFRNLKDAIQLYNTTVSKIAIETKEGCTTVLSSDIVYVEAKGRKVTIHTLQRDYLSIHKMDYWVNTLQSSCFVVSHRSFIVNLKYVSDFDHTLIHLCGNQFDAYLTRRKYTEFKNAYLLYLESTR